MTTAGQKTEALGKCYPFDWATPVQSSRCLRLLMQRMQTYNFQNLGATPSNPYFDMEKDWNSQSH